MQAYNSLSLAYNRLYQKNIEFFKQNIINTGYNSEWFVDFYPSFGIKKTEKCDIMFYGQAVNGWGSGFNTEDEINKLKIEESILASNRYYSKLNHTPLDWVNVRWSKSTYDEIIKDQDFLDFYEGFNNYWTYRSLFWKIVFKLTSDFYGLSRNSGEWAKKTVWSNLYKIAPDGANPDEFLRQQQFEKSVELIHQEIEEIKPKYCIVLTNLSWWKPFGEGLKTQKLNFDKSLGCIEAYEQLKDTKIIVTTRPRFGSGENHVKQLLSIMDSNRLE